jgi:hypothetical protein
MRADKAGQGRKPKFRVGQVVARRLTSCVGKVLSRYRDSSGSNVWWYEMVGDATPWAEQELRALTKREARRGL